MPQPSARTEGVSDQLLATAKRYAADLNEAQHLVHAALVNLLRRDPNLGFHPVLSGQLKAEIDAMQARQAPAALAAAPAA